MFDRIARRYDLLNRVMSFGQDRRWRDALVAELVGDRILDVATGTGDVAAAICRARPGVAVVGLDPSVEMLAVAQAKVRDDVELVAGDAQAMPFADNSFSSAAMAFGIRNVPDRPRALSEMARVVWPGGRVAVLELTEPSGSLLSAAARLHVRYLVPLLGRWLSTPEEYAYLERSIAAFPSPEVFADTMRSAGLRQVTVERLSFGAVTLFVATV